MASRKSAQDKALGFVYRRISRDGELSPQQKYEVCLQAAGAMLATYLLGDPTPGAARAPPIIVQAALDHLANNPAVAQGKEIAETIDGLPIASRN